MADLAKDKLVRKVVGAAPIVLPCALCGAPLPHFEIEPFHQAKLAYRSTVIGRHVYAPAGHSHGGFCDDPEGAAAALWSRHGWEENAERREGYRRMRRDVVAARVREWRQ